jgi:cytochrome c oxidase subunit II
MNDGQYEDGPYRIAGRMRRSSRPLPVPRGRRTSLRATVLALLSLCALGLVFASSALADAFTPESGPSENANDIDTLYKILFFMGLAVIALVWGLLFYSLAKFRARRRAVAPQIRGNSPLELGWTAGAASLVAIIALITFVMLGGIKNPARSGPDGLAEASGQFAVLNQPPPEGGRGLDVKVGGQQYFWRFQYPNGAVSFHDLVVPRDTTVTLEITSNDVPHSWWIPKMGGKADALRGYNNRTWFKATKTGTYPGQCAEFCGANHAAMTASVVVLEPDAYQRWVGDQKKQITAARDAVAKQRAQNQVPGDAAQQAGAGQRGGPSARIPKGTKSQRPGQGPLAD